MHLSPVQSNIAEVTFRIIDVILDIHFFNFFFEFTMASDPKDATDTNEAKKQTPIEVNDWNDLMKHVKTTLIDYR